MKQVSVQFKICLLWLGVSAVFHNVHVISQDNIAVLVPSLCTEFRNE